MEGGWMDGWMVDGGKNEGSQSAKAGGRTMGGWMDVGVDGWMLMDVARN
jgi:hypothetical protein